MTSLRVWLLLLLAVLIPVRGALAVGMSCHAGGQAPLQVHAQVHATASSMTHAHDHGHAGAQAHSHGTDSHEADASADKCNLCSASCAATALVSAERTAIVRQPVAATFPQPHAPPPAYVQEGQERPPRST